jgi:hypothetical protein
MEFDVLIFGVLSAGAVLIVNQLARIIRARILHGTIREAIARDSQALPGLLQGIEEKAAPAQDDRTGLVLIALGAAIFLFGVVQGDADDIRSMAGIALFPFLVGVVLFGRFLYIGRKGAA